ncbi:MAG: hypothetical protein ACU0AT_08915 [Tranquillimonas sp.]
MIITRVAAALALLLALGACAVDPVYDPIEEVQRAAYVSEGPASLTLYTVLRNKDDSGAHSGLLIDGPQRVLFDPAGSFKLPFVPERGDVLYGFSPRVEKVYVDFHARETFRVVKQTIQVSPEVAARALRLAESYGSVPPAQCSRSITKILQQIPGFEDMPVRWFPQRTARDFGERPGVTTEVIRDTDADGNHGVLIRAAQRGPDGI